jgi:hypothetical protein
MSKFLVAAALGVSLFATGAAAQQDPSLYSPYCLRDGRAGTVICAYATFQQCLSVRMGTDDCMPNPRFPVARPRSR